MRVLLQRVSEAQVAIEGIPPRRIGEGLLLFLGIEGEDEESDVEWLAGKVLRLRIFSDEEGKMNRSVTEIGGDILLISQFTLHASTKKGNRPSFVQAARPDVAIPRYEAFGKALEEGLGRPISRGEFGAEMKVSLINDGPVTIWIDSRNRE
ncbi:MAG: D-aminoacyl-tRNA deacylase [Verrucomicrobiota bacterium]